MPGGLEIVAWSLRVLGVYAALGAVFAVWFVIAGVGRISPAARGTGWGFRLLIWPGSAALWPLLMYELIASRGRGGVVVGRVLRADDVETALDGVEVDDVETADGSGEEPVVGSDVGGGGGRLRDLGGPARFVDPEAETDAGPGVGVDEGAGS